MATENFGSEIEIPSYITKYAQDYRIHVEGSVNGN